MNNSMYGDPPKKKATETKKTPASKITVDAKTGASANAYPKTRTETKDRNGNNITSITDSTKKLLFSGQSKDAKTKQEVQNFKKDSTGYVKSADHEARDYNLKKSINEATANASAFVGKKKK